MPTPARVRIPVVAIAVFVIAGSTLSAPPSEAELRQDYEALTDKRFADNTRRIEEVAASMRRQAKEVERFREVAEDWDFIHRWFWWAVGFLSFFGALLLEILRRLATKYIPPAWAWLMHLHACMDLTRETVVDNSKAAEEFRAKTRSELRRVRKALHLHAKYLERVGASQDLMALDAEARATKESD